MRPMTFLLVLFALLLLAGSALAMSSTNYRLDWFVPLTGSGRRAARSANYAVNFTAGQTAIGAPASANYEGCLGYWCGVRRGAGSICRWYFVGDVIPDPARHSDASRLPDGLGAGARLSHSRALDLHLLRQ